MWLRHGFSGKEILIPVYMSFWLCGHSKCKYPIPYMQMVDNNGYNGK